MQLSSFKLREAESRLTPVDSLFAACCGMKENRFAVPVPSLLAPVGSGTGASSIVDK